MLVKYKITSYDNYVDPVVKIVSEINLDDDMMFVDMVRKIVGMYDKSYLKKQIYVEDLVEKTWNKYFDFDYIFNVMECDSFHYGWLKANLRDVNKSFGLFDEEINIVIDGPGIGRIIDNKEGIKIVIHTNENQHSKYPHVHAIYGEEEIFIYLKDGKILNNDKFKSNKKTKVAVNYVMENKEKLLADWELITGNKVSVDMNMYI